MTSTHPPTSSSISQPKYHQDMAVMRTIYTKISRGVNPQNTTTETDFRFDKTMRKGIKNGFVFAFRS